MVWLLIGFGYARFVLYRFWLVGFIVMFVWVICWRVVVGLVLTCWDWWVLVVDFINSVGSLHFATIYFEVGFLVGDVWCLCGYVISVGCCVVWFGLMLVAGMLFG